MQRFIKATSISVLSLFLVGTATVATFALTHRTSGDTASQPTVSATQPIPQPPTRAELLKLVNAERAKVGVKPLVESPILDKSAQWKANDEEKFNYFGHVKPGTKGNNGLDYLNGLNPPCVYVSENLVENINPSTGTDFDNTSKGSVDAWVASAAHYRAMTNSDYTLTGFGINGDFVVEHFCQQ